MAIRERIRQTERALINLDYSLPYGRTMINLAPVDLRKDAGVADRAGHAVDDPPTSVETGSHDPMMEELSLNGGVRRVRRIVGLRADAETRARVEELAEKCNEGELMPQEHAEYQSYVSTSTFIAILQAKARALLKHHAKSR